MTVWGNLGNGARTALLLGGAAVVGGAGWLWLGDRAGAPPADPVPVAAVSEPPEATPAQPDVQAAEERPDPAPEDALPDPAPENALPEPPRFDTVRIETDGAALVAGQAAAGSTVAILVNGAEVAQVPVDSSGAFAAMFDLPASEQPRSMTLDMLMPDGKVIAAQAEVVIAPILPAVSEPAPSEVAAADASPPEVTVASAPAEPPTALLIDDAGASVLTPPPADVPVSVDAITYAADGTVLVAGHGTPGAMLRLYLDNAEAAVVQVAPEGTWALPLAGVTPGLYTLRADQVDPAGKVVSRFETPFKRETLEALAAASVKAAADPAPDVAEEPAPDQTPDQTTKPPAAAPAPIDATQRPEPPPPAAAPEGAASPAADPAAPVAPAATDAATVATAAVPAPPPVAAPDPAPVAPAPPVTVTVQPGFTLWRIARETFGDGVMYVQVFEANRDKIRDPDLIYPGQVFALPVPVE